ncbi:MAG TPA: glutamate-cysteine ligase family protein [Geothermobacteraceae bacterium]|nr:glutamate-cysteine ligase family protein [Geothermobacteraceae bacterium]
MSTLTKPELTTVIRQPQQLIDYLAAGGRPRPQWGIGAESERIVVDANTGEAADYPRIEKLLESISNSGSWREIREDGHLLALIGEKSSITLEPGGQLELSGRLCKNIHCCHADFSTHIAQVITAAEPLGLICLGLGAQPFTPLDQIAWLPKARYGIMGPYMGKTGTLGQAMMKQTAGLQVNIDFSDEADCMAKLRLGQVLSPLLYALFANSPVMSGQPIGHLSVRGEIWANTDADRTGLIPALFKADSGFRDYVAYALDVPMYFIVRDNHYIDLTGVRTTFRDYLDSTAEPLMSDWDLHLSTLFTEVRLRPQIEFRSADSLPPDLSLSVAALLKGIFYDPEALAETWALYADYTTEDHLEAYRNSWTLGLNTRLGGLSFGDLAHQVLEIARLSLQRQQCLNDLGQDEAIFLDGLSALLETNSTLANQLLQQWSGDRARDLELLKRHCGFL